MFERSFHFIPANRPDFFRKIDTVPADAFIFDLEDAVSVEQKPHGLRFLDAWLATHETERPIFVRVNGPDSIWMEGEIELLRSHPNLGLVLPKAGPPSETESAIEKYLGENQRDVILLVETLTTLPHIAKLAVLPHICGIGLGLEDLLSNLPFHRGDLVTFVSRIRTELALHCAGAGISAINSISLDFTDGTNLEVEAIAARAAGMSAMFSIHPSQVLTINRIFSPLPEQIEEAKQILASAGYHGELQGYRKTNGILLSPPKIRKAQTIIESVRNHEH